jgi:hypothetical protein
LQAVIFRLVKKFPPLPEADCMDFLITDAEGVVTHPQKISGIAARLCVAQLMLADASRLSAGKLGIYTPCSSWWGRFSVL